jgi:hypothetical protein
LVTFFTLPALFGNTPAMLGVFAVEELNEDVLA